MISPIRFVAANLARRRLRSFVTAAGVGIAVAALFSLLSFQRSYEAGLREDLNHLGAHLLVVPKGCPYDAASVALHGASWPCYLKSAYLTTVRETPHVAVAAPVLMSACYEGTTGAEIVYCGVQPDIMSLKRSWRISGAFPTHSGDILVGCDIAKSHGWRLGDRVTLPGMAPARGHIAGILARTDGADDLFIYMRLQDMQVIFHRPGQLTHILVRLDRPESMDAVVANLRGCDAGLDMNVVPLAHLFDTIRNLVESTRLLLDAVAFVALLAAGAGVSNTILMAIMERKREIGTLRALGASGARIFGLIWAETVVLCLGGAVAGIAAAVWGRSLLEAWLRARLPFAPHGALIRPNPDIISICILGAIILGSLAALAPAWRAACLTPVEAKRVA